MNRAAALTASCPAVSPQTADPADRPVEEDGWRLLSQAPAGFEGRLPPLFVRPLEGMRAQLRVQPDAACANLAGGLHGGFQAALAEQSLILPLYLHGRVERTGIVVIDFSLSFLAGGAPHLPILARIELMQETGRMAFVRGTLSQNGAMITHYSGTVRKLPRS